MCEWKEYQLSDVAEIVGGGTPKTKESDYWNGEIAWLTPRDLSNFNGRYISKGERNISKLGLAKSSAKILPKGTVLLSSRAPVGYLAIAKNEITTNQGFRSLIPNSKTNNHFLFYLLKNNVEYLKSQSTGTTFGELAGSTLKSLSFSFPPLPEQRAIASVLSSLDDKIDLLHRQNKTLEAMAETLFRQWFVEEADEGWVDGKLGDYVNVKHGYAFKGKFITTGKNKQILVTPGNFKIGGGFKVGKMKYFIGSDYPKDYIFSSDDLIVTMTDLSKEGDTLGYSALIPEHNQDEVLYLHNQRVGKVEFKKDISKYFFYYLMKTDDYQWFILSGASGTSIMHTSPTSICSYPFKVPPMKRIEQFDAVVSELISKMHKNQKQIRTLEKLRDTLLPKLMSGEVRVELKQQEAVV